MDAEHLEELLNAGESTAVEFKSSLADSRRIIETIAGMATAGGGVILVGVDPEGKPIGVGLPEGARERFVQRVLAGTDPKIFVDLAEQQSSGQTILMIKVPGGDGPHLAFGRPFYRSGPATIAMTRDEYERRLMDRLRESGGYERHAESDWSIDLIDPGSVRDFVERATVRQPLAASSPHELLSRLHLLREERVTVAGILLFGREPQGPLPQATIRIRALRGVSRDESAIDGTLFDQIDGAARIVARNLKTRSSREGLLREDIPELPEAAVREVIANAIAHRDYRSTAPIQIRLDDDALTIWNPGHFPPPITPALLRGEHPSVPTNPLMARALYLAGYIEEWGTGTLRVIDAMRHGGNSEPIFEQIPEEGGIRVSLPLPGALPPGLSPRQAEFLQTQPTGSRFRTSEYAETQNIARRTALEDLRQLEALGLVRREGRGKASRWVRL